MTSEQPRPPGAGGPDREQLLRDLNERVVIAEAEQAARGIRKLTVLHGLDDPDGAELAELYEAVDAVCAEHRIDHWPSASTSIRLLHWQGLSRTTWRFRALTDLVAVRTVIEQRWPHWPIEAYSH